MQGFEETFLFQAAEGRVNGTYGATLSGLPGISFSDVESISLISQDAHQKQNDLFKFSESLIAHILYNCRTNKTLFGIIVNYLFYNIVINGKTDILL